MTTSADLGADDEGGGDLFRASSVEKAKGAHALNKLRQEDVDTIKVGDDGVSDEELVDLGARPVDSDENDSDFDNEHDQPQRHAVDSNGNDDDSRLRELEEEMDYMYSEYVERQRERDARYDIKRRRENEGEFHGFSDDDKSAASDSDGESDAASLPSQDVSDEEEIRDMVRQAKLAKTEEKKKKKRTKSQDDVKLAGRAALWFDQPAFKGPGGVNLANITDDEDSDNGISANNNSDAGSNSDDDFDVMSVDDDGGDPNDVELKDEERQADYDLATPEAMTMLRDLANRKTTKHDLIDKHFNRHTFNDTTGLPEWFVDDEKKNNKPMLPVTKEAVRMLREKLKALDARPIKKVAEAKARKKMRAAKRIAGMQKKAETVISNEDMTEAEKARSIDRMIKRATKAKPKTKTTLVVARNSNRRLKGRPRGVKGKYKMVDARMKKDLRAQKMREKASKSSRRK
ncbi:AdoMet-dependent rRNA methyltransferase spb1 [Coemansia sp. RSA 2559]|nr:AdoMet-dependent rRNA methyltransferase spb1 [Coemansia sp. RSA 2559]